jgi:hypothetical protein
LLCLLLIPHTAYLMTILYSSNTGLVACEAFAYISGGIQWTSKPF